MSAEKTILSNSNTIFSTLSVPENIHNLRIDQFIVSQFAEYSRSFFKKLITKQNILLNSIPIKKAGVIVKPGDVITILVSPDPDIKELLKKKLLAGSESKNKKIEINKSKQNKSGESASEASTLNNNKLESDELADNEPESSHPIFHVSILYTHEHFLIIHKPSGLTVHKPHAHSNEITVVDWILARYEEIAHIGLIDRPGIVHRIDKNTSGLLIIARTNYGHAAFSKLFKDRMIHKIYLAFVKGHPDRSGTIELAIGRDPVTKTKMIALEANDLRSYRMPKMRDALTHYQVKHYSDIYSLLEIKLITGRTHQIRAHFAAIGHPLVGDTVYGGPESPYIKRQALHAHSISFVFDGQKFSFSCPIPADMQSLIKTI